MMEENESLSFSTIFLYIYKLLSLPDHNNLSNVYLSQYLCLLCSLFAAFVTLYKLLRPGFPIKVNCWFCNADSKVDYDLRNNWICKKCDQYNGFTEDGDYNKEMNSSEKSESSCKKITSDASRWSNGLCYKCNTNQELKILQLSNFQPMNDRNYEAEINLFEKHLDRVYDLCDRCKNCVNKKLEKDKCYMLGNKLRATKSQKDSKLKYKLRENIVSRSRTLAPVVTASLLIVFIVKILSEPKIYFSKKSIHLMTSNMLNVFNSVKNHTEYVMHYLKLDRIFIDFDYSNYFNINKEIFGISGLFTTFDWIFSKVVPILSILGFSLSFLLIVCIPKYSIRNILSLTIWLILSWSTLLGDKHLCLIQVLFVLLANYLFHKENVSKINYYGKLSEVKSPGPKYTSFTLDNLESKNDYVSINKHQQIPTSNKLNYGFKREYFANSSPINEHQDNFSQSQFSDDESELDDSISSLNLGNNRSPQISNNNVFSKWESNCPNPVTTKSILSPSRFSFNTYQKSWVAGGFWGSDNVRTNLHDNSRSSSQSSGFESVASVVNAFSPFEKDLQSKNPASKYSNINFLRNKDYFVPKVNNNFPLKPRAQSTVSSNRNNYFNQSNKDFEYSFQPLYRPL